MEGASVEKYISPEEWQSMTEELATWKELCNDMGATLASTRAECAAQVRAKDVQVHDLQLQVRQSELDVQLMRADRGYHQRTLKHKQGLLSF